MGAWEIHQEYLKKRYVASTCTCACLLYLVSIICLVLVPLGIGFGTRSFWIKEKFFHDDPDVEFQSNMVVMVEGQGSVRPFSYLWTTSPALNDLIGGDSLIVPTVTVASKDINGDGNINEFKMSVSVPTSISGQQEGVQRVVIIAFLNYKLHGEAKLDMDSLAILDASTGFPASSLKVVGDLVLSQREPLRVTHSYKTPYTDTPLWNENKGLDGVQIGSIITNYMERNFTTTFKYPYPMWQMDSSFGSSQGTGTSSGTFTADVTIRIPSTLVFAIPATSEMIKWAWVQYLSILVVVWVLVRWARIFVFGQRLVASTAITDLAGKEHMY